MNVSRTQIFWLVFISEIVMLTYFALGSSLKHARQDIWVSFSIALAASLLGAFFITKLGLLYPNKTIAEYVPLILGRWLGKTIVLAYVCFWLFTAIVLLRATLDFLCTNLLYSTPMVALLVMEIALMLYFNLSGGFVTIGRCGEVIGPLLFVAAFLPFFLNTGHLDHHQLLPVFAQSRKSVFEGSLFAYSFLGETTMLFMAIAFLKDTGKAVSNVLGAVGLGGLWGGAMSVIVVMMFGPESASDMYHPQFMFMKSISILNFIQNFDLVITFFLQFGIMIKLANQLFVSSYGLSQLLKTNRWKPIACILAILLFVCLLSTSKMDYDFLIKPWIFMLFNFAIPLVLWTFGGQKQRAR